MFLTYSTFGLVMVKWCQEIVFVLSMGETKVKVLLSWFISKRIFEWFIKNNMLYSFVFNEWVLRMHFFLRCWEFEAGLSSKGQP